MDTIVERKLICSVQVGTKLNSGSFDRAFAESQGDLANDSRCTTERDPLICRRDQADAGSALHQGSRLGQSHPRLGTPQWRTREEGRHYWDFGGQPKRHCWAAPEEALQQGCSLCPLARLLCWFREWTVDLLEAQLNSTFSYCRGHWRHFHRGASFVYCFGKLSLIRDD